MKMDYFETDLSYLINDKHFHFEKNDRKLIMRDIIRAVDFLHSNFLLHRDLKPSNILINSKGLAVLTDFGLAKKFANPDMELTQGVITRWYRPPELLFRARYYGEKVDVWSIGCIFAELFLKKPLFRGDTDIDQLSKIFGIRGTPSNETWPNVQKLPNFIKFQESLGVPLK